VNECLVYTWKQDQKNWNITGKSTIGDMKWKIELSICDSAKNIAWPGTRPDPTLTQYDHSRVWVRAEKKQIWPNPTQPGQWSGSGSGSVFWPEPDPVASWFRMSDCLDFVRCDKIDLFGNDGFGW
jgi:hypothetical protein